MKHRVSRVLMVHKFFKAYSNRRTSVGDKDALRVSEA